MPDLVIFAAVAQVPELASVGEAAGHQVLSLLGMAAKRAVNAAFLPSVQWHRWAVHAVVDDSNARFGPVMIIRSVWSFGLNQTFATLEVP